MRRFAERAGWMRARAANVLRRPLPMLLIGAATAALVLATLLLVPGRAHRAAAEAVATIPERPDSLPIIRLRAEAVGEISRIDSLLHVVRLDVVEPLPLVVDTLPPHLVAHRDSLRIAINAISALIQRTELAPIPPSYRAVGESRWMADVPNVRALLDSLSEIERDRESFGAVTGVDPMYMALTARANAIGREIVGAAQARRASLRAELAPLLPPPPPPRPTVLIDTLRLLEERAEAERYILGANEELTRIRSRNRDIDALERRARELREVGAPFSATVAAALVVGLAVAFALLLLSEMRDPRVADVSDAEQTTRTRVLAVVRPTAVPAERARRRADVGIPAVLDPFAEHYRQLHLRLTAREEPVKAVTITGEEPEITAVVAINLAAYEMREARSAVVVDGEAASAGVARALDIPAAPGLTNLVTGDLTWPDVMQYVNMGRDQVLAVLPSGLLSARPSPQRAAVVRADLERLAGRHDLLVFTALPDRTHHDPSSLLLSSDVVLCARLGHTRIRRLRRMVQRLRGERMVIHGLLIWDAEPPRLPPARSLGVARATPRPSEPARV